MRRQRGFTLLELLAALCVSGIALAAAETMLSRSAQMISALGKKFEATGQLSPACSPNPAAPIFLCSVSKGDRNDQTAIIPE